jgi:hypothetical protein
MTEIDPTTTIISPPNAWCRSHWQAVVADPTVNSVFAAMRVVSRILELDRFVDLCYPQGYVAEKPDPARISEVLAEIAPLCCWLGDDEMSLLRGEARAIGQRRS